jgi:hypothetical protein
MGWLLELVLENWGETIGAVTRLIFSVPLYLLT